MTPGGWRGELSYSWQHHQQTSSNPLSAFTGLPAPAGSTDPAAPAASFNARAHRQTAFPPLLWLWCYCSSRCSAASARTATSASYSAASKIIPGVHIAVLPQTWASWTSQHHRDIAADDKTWHTRCTITLTLMSWGGWKNKDTPPPSHTPTPSLKNQKRWETLTVFYNPTVVSSTPSVKCVLMLLKRLREARVCAVGRCVCFRVCVRLVRVRPPPLSAAATASCGPHGSSALPSSSPTAVKTSSDRDRLRSERMTHSSHKKGTKL